MGPLTTSATVFFRMRSTLAPAAALIAALLGTTLHGCMNSPTAAAPSPFAQMEDERLPLQESDCLEGEYFDRATESCEPLETSKDVRQSDDDAQLDLPDDRATPTP